MIIALTMLWMNAYQKLHGDDFIAGMWILSVIELGIEATILTNLVG